TIACVSSACSGMPVPGMILYPTSTCIGDTIHLNLFDAETGPSITYQWQKDTGSGFTSFGTSAYSQRDYITVNTTYRCIITCSTNGDSSITQPVTVVVVSPPSAGPITGSTTGCSNTPLSDITTSGGFGTYQWSVKKDTLPYYDIISSDSATLSGYVPAT